MVRIARLSTREVVGEQDAEPIATGEATLGEVMGESVAGRVEVGKGACVHDAVRKVDLDRDVRAPIAQAWREEIEQLHGAQFYEAACGSPNASPATQPTAATSAVRSRRGS